MKVRFKGCDHAYFTGQAIQVRFKGCDIAHFTGQAMKVRFKGCDYAHFTAQSIQVRLKGCMTMPTSGGQAIQVIFNCCDWLGTTMLISLDKPHR